MPIYELICRECGAKYERIVSFSAQSYPECPACGSADVQRQLGKPAIHFKGSGWYITDSKADEAKRKGGNGKVNGSGDADGEADAKKEAPAETAKTTSSETSSTSKASESD